MKAPMERLHRWQAPPVPDHLEARVREALERTRVATPVDGALPMWLLSTYGVAVVMLLIVVARTGPLPRRTVVTSVSATASQIREGGLHAIPPGHGAVITSQVDLRDYAAISDAVLKVEGRR